jgi:diacylglycerol kinase family enzyme
MQVLMLVNRKAGASHAAELVAEATRELAQAGLATTITGDLAEFSVLAQELANSAELRAIVSCGGDGTATSALNHSPVNVPLAILPLGTENLLARHFGIRRDPRQMVETIVAGRTVQLDMGLAAGRLFSIMASAGFDAEVVRRLHERRTGNIRHWSYLQPILAAMRNYEYPELRVYCDQSPDRATAETALLARWFFAFNLPCYARGLPLAPRADGTDGQFDLCMFERGTTLRGLWYLANVVARRHERLPDNQCRMASRVRIESDDEVPYQLDGDFAGYLPLEIEIVPGRMQLLVPPNSRIDDRRSAG